MTLEQRIQQLISQLHWQILIQAQQIEDQQKEIENLKSSAKDSKSSKTRKASD